MCFKFQIRDMFILYHFYKYGKCFICNRSTLLIKRTKSACICPMVAIIILFGQKTGQEFSCMNYSILENRLTIVDVQTLRLVSGMEPLQSALLKRALSASLFTLSAVTDEDETVGMLRVAGDGAYIFVIADLLVRPDARGEGIGSALVNAALDRMCAMLPSSAWSTVTLVAAEGKESFYERLGFHTLPHGAAGHGMQTFIHGCSPQ